MGGTHSAHCVATEVSSEDVVSFASSMADRPDSLPALNEGGVYFATAASPLDEGTPAVHVRTELQPGEDRPQAFFVYARGRVVFQRWTPLEDVAAEWTEAYEPPKDPSPVGSAWKSEVYALRAERDELAEQLDAENTGAAAERDVLVAVMKLACELAPEHRAALVAKYRELLKGASS